jgi:type II secretory pathway predicted ATPase ExeA
MPAHRMMQGGLIIAGSEHVNESFYYPRQSLKKYLHQLSAFTKSHEPLLIITGEAGMGKTALLSAFYLSGEAPADMLVIKGRDTLTPEKLILKLTQEFHLESPPDKLTYLDMLADILEQMGRLPAKALLVIDNADRVPIATLAAIMYCCLTQKESQVVLQLMLFGKPSFKNIISNLHQATISFGAIQLEPLSFVETKNFLHETVQSMRVMNAFEMTDEMIQTIYKKSLGIPGDIARLAEESLHLNHFTVNNTEP